MTLPRPADTGPKPVVDVAPADRWKDVAEAGSAAAIGLDAQGRLLGIVSRADLLKVFLRSDESIRREVVQDLLSMPLIGLAKIDVEVNDGVVTLYGADEAEGNSELVSRRVAGMPGVVGVKRRPRLTPEVEAADLAPAQGNG